MHLVPLVTPDDRMMIAMSFAIILMVTNSMQGASLGISIDGCKIPDKLLVIHY